MPTTDKEPMDDETEVETPTEDTKETASAETPDESTKETPDNETGDVKVPEAFQKEAMALVEGCTTMACLDFLSSEINDKRSKMMKAESDSGTDKAEFNTDGMPDDS